MPITRHDSEFFVLRCMHNRYPTGTVWANLVRYGHVPGPEAHSEAAARRLLDRGLLSYDDSTDMVALTSEGESVFVRANDAVEEELNALSESYYSAGRDLADDERYAARAAVLRRVLV